MYIYGTEGNLLCTCHPPELPFAETMLRVHLVDQDTRVQLFEKGKSGARDIPLLVGDPVLEEIDEFADCIRTGGKPETDVREPWLPWLSFGQRLNQLEPGKPASIDLLAKGNVSDQTEMLG